MKKAILLIPAILIGTLLMGCGQNDTELGFTNGPGNADVNDIIWADGDQTWAKTGGYSEGESTGPKIVMQTSGSVECVADFGFGFVTANVVFDSNNDGLDDSNALSLNDGESNIYTIKQVNP